MVLIRTLLSGPMAPEVISSLGPDQRRVVTEALADA